MVLSCLVPLRLWFFCLVLHTRLCYFLFVLRDTDRILLLHESFQQSIGVNQCYSLLYLRYKLAKVQSFITSLIHLESGLCHNKPLHHAQLGKWQIHLSRTCERLFNKLGLIDQVLGSMICGMDYHQVVYRNGQVIIIITQRITPFNYLTYSNYRCRRKVFYHCHAIFIGTARLQ
jgi:hypothetical protein